MSTIKGNSLWQIELALAKSYIKPPQKLQENEILLKGTLKEKSLYFKVSDLTEIASPEYQ